MIKDRDFTVFCNFIRSKLHDEKYDMCILTNVLIVRCKTSKSQHTMCPSFIRFSGKIAQKDGVFRRKIGFSRDYFKKSKLFVY